MDQSERERKWVIYNDVLKYIKPSPSWTGLENHYSKDDLMKHFSLDEDETESLTKTLIKEKKLVRDGDLYRSIRCCSICGKEFDDLDIQENNHFRKYFGYGSKHDLDVLDVDLCIDCMDKLVDNVLPHLPKSCLTDEYEHRDLIKNHDPF